MAEEHPEVVSSLEPTQITTRIYQGGWLRPHHIPELVRLGITHVLNLDLPSTDPLPLAEANITLHTIPVRDYCLMTPQLVREIMEAIDRVLSSPAHKIYIHCVVGVSRSPTIAWLYLIHKGHSPEDATAKVKPNPALYDAGIVQQLMTHRP
jgi:protein-tyrosine phosphatase